MPTYDVKCEKCDVIYEIKHSIVKDHPSCFDCGSELKTVFLSAPPVRFRGDGWTPRYSNIKDQRNYSKGRIEERKQSLREGGSINEPDDFND